MDVFIISSHIAQSMILVTFLRIVVFYKRFWRNFLYFFNLVSPRFKRLTFRFIIAAPIFMDLNSNWLVVEEVGLVAQCYTSIFFGCIFNVSEIL